MRWLNRRDQEDKLLGFWRDLLTRWFSRPPDHRASPRFHADVPVVLSLVEDQEIACVRALANGISEGGLSVSGAADLAVGETVSLEIQLPTATKSLWVEAVVRHNSGHYGLQFTSLSDQQTQLIKRYCRMQPRQKRRA